MQLGFPNRRATLALFVLAGALAGAISWIAGQSQNFDVFSAASNALVHGEDLYAKNAADYFKYSPTFALLFLPFTWGPAFLLAPLWSALNFGAAAWGIDRFCDRDPRSKRVAMLVALAGIVVATDGDQSNLLVAGAALLAFVAYERGRLRLAAHLVAAATLVKIFPIAIGALVLFLPRGQRRPAFVELGRALLVWIAMPLVLIGPEELGLQYASWHALLGRDHGNHGWSVMSFAQDALRLRWSTASIQVLAIAAQGFPIVMGVRYGTDRAWRRKLVTSLLAFVVLFNHRAEYATFAISAVAVGLWLASDQEPAPLWKRALVVLAILAPGPFFTQAASGTSGIVGVLAAHRLFHPLRVLPLLVVWMMMQRELLARFFEVHVRVRSATLAHAPMNADGANHAP